MTDPLLSEFDSSNRFAQFLRALPPLSYLLRPEATLKGSRVALTFFWIALSTSILSVLCNAGLLSVKFINTETTAKPPHEWPIAFGYLQEMNAAFLYLFLAPLFVFLGIRFIGNSEFALNGLADGRRLITNAKYKKQKDLNKNPLVTLSRMNRRVFRPSFLLVIVVVTASIIILTEFLPPNLVPGRRGDYWGLAFGYIQAEALHGYEGKYLQDLDGREVKKIPGISEGDPLWTQHWQVTNVSPGPVTRAEKFLFWVFVVFALGVQVLFVPFAIWIFFKAIFFLRFVYRAISPNERSPLEIKLEFEDKGKTFGLKDLHGPYNYIIAMIFVGAIGMASVVIANVPKGSHRTLSREGSFSIFGSVGQGVTTFLPLFLLIVLVIFLFLLRMKTEEAREAVVRSIDRKIAESRTPKKELEARRELVCAQTAWPDAVVKTWLGASLPSFIFPALVLANNRGLAEAVYNSWLIVVNIFNNLLQPLHGWINRIFG
jgi:uncharacterized membrane protein